MVAADRTVGRRQLRLTRHRLHDLLTAVLAAVGHVIDLPPWQQDADLHWQLATGALRSVGEQTVLGWRWAHRAESGHGVVSPELEGSNGPDSDFLVNNR